MKEELNKMQIHYTKKGQLEIGVTMMVILVFIILLIVSFLFYFRFVNEDIKETREELLDSQYSILLNNIMNMPELKCSFNAVDKECLDAAKLIAFKNLIKDDIKAKNYYNELFLDINKVIIDVVYPEEDLVECEANYPYCNQFSIFGDINEGKIYSMPIALYYSELKIYKIGELKIYIKT